MFKTVLRTRGNTGIALYMTALELKQLYIEGRQGLLPTLITVVRKRCHSTPFIALLRLHNCTGFTFKQTEKRSSLTFLSIFMFVPQTSDWMNRDVDWV